MSQSSSLRPSRLLAAGRVRARWQWAIVEISSARTKSRLTCPRLWGQPLITSLGWRRFCPQGSLDNISIILLCFPGAPQLSAEALHQEAELEDLLEAKVAGITGIFQYAMFIKGFPCFLINSNLINKNNSDSYTTLCRHVQYRHLSTLTAIINHHLCYYFIVSLL